MLISLRRNNHTLYLTGLVLLAAGLPLSLFLTSVSQFFLAGSFLLEGNPREKIKRFFSNRAAVLFAGIVLLHILGLCWTSDFHEGFKDVRIKLPLLLMPLIIAGTEPLSTDKFKWVLWVFIFAVLTGTLISMMVLAGIIHHPVHDIRDIFIFNISHIRFSLFICTAIVSIGWMLWQQGFIAQQWFRIFLALTALWLIAFLFISESLTGLCVLLLCGITLTVQRVIANKNPLVRVSILLIVVLVPLSLFIYLRNYFNEVTTELPEIIDLSQKSRLGNPYFFDISNPMFENGNNVWVYVCDSELRPGWMQRSRIPYDSLDERGQPVRYTLVRFMASKGLRKDADGLQHLSETEIRAVEKGIANVNFQHVSSIHSRVMQTLWEIKSYLNGDNPSGHSTTQRLEFWKAAIGIIHRNPWMGVGTGDMPSAYKTQYEYMNSSLWPQYRLRAHNQFLAITVAFGFAGLIYFLVAFFYPVIILKKYQDFIFFSIWLIIFFSMFTEDTLETQPGASFVAFFFCLFLFGRKHEASKQLD